VSQAPPDNAGSPAVLNGGDPEHPAAHPVREAGAASGRRGRGKAGPAMNQRTGQALDDWRLRSLRTGPGGDVSVVSPRTDHRHRYQRPLLATAAVFVAVAALAVVLMQAFVIQPYAVGGDAMTPTLQGGDRILVLKSGLLRGTISSGDIVVVHPAKTLPCSVAEGSSGDLVLRVAAVPGDVISSVGDRILVDGRPLRERGRYDPRFGEVGSTPIRKTTLTAGRYFALADNRSNACDSRTFGPISDSSIAGKGIAVVGRAGHVSFGTL
jgi:signal peptidase I